MTWREQAACKGMDSNLFFPERGGSPSRFTKAIAVCGVCPVTAECLDYSIQPGQVAHFGIWGGLKGNQRRKVMR